MLPFPAYFPVSACSPPAILFTGVLVVITFASNKYSGLGDMAGLAAAEYSIRRMGAAWSAVIRNVRGPRKSKIHFLR